MPTCTTGAVPTARLGDAVLDLYHFTRALPHPAASLTAFAEMWQQEAPPQQTEWGRELLGIALARAQGVKALLDSGAAIAARDEKADAAYTAVMLDDARPGREPLLPSGAG